MYDKNKINRFTERYLNGKKDVIDDLLKALTPMIDIILSKGYSSRKSDWDDLKQGCLLELFEILKRKPMGLRIALAEWNNVAGYFYFRVRSYLNLNFDREKYDDNKKNTIFFENLPGRYKNRLGLPADENDFL